MVITPKAGSRITPRPTQAVFRLKQSAGAWTIETVEEKR
jgi:hypothetical protein